MGIEKSYARATVSSNLKDDEFHHDHEKLAAVALSGLGEGIWPHANMLLRVKYAGDASSYYRLAEEWRAHVKIKAALRGWPIEISASKVARISLDYWLNDVCPVCTGRGSLPVAGIPNVLLDDPCPVCAGTGARPIDLHPSKVEKYGHALPSTTSCAWWPTVRPAKLVNYVKDMVELLQTLTIRAGGEAIRKLSEDVSGLP
jgi:hypothetical protein